MTAAVVLRPGIEVFERGWLSSNNVLFTTGTTAAVDTGYVTHADQTVALVRHALGERALDVIANTHLHSDHCGGNAALQAAYPQANTLIPPGQSDAVARWDESALTYSSTGQHCARFRFDAVLRPGAVVELGEAAWQVHAAPGHDPDSVVLFEPQGRILISADALWENGFGIVFPELDGASAFDEVRGTLDLIERLQPELVIPGHGSAFSGTPAVQGSLERARSRLAAYVEDPCRHASHAMKVLIKFKLLEWQQVTNNDFSLWARAMPYMRQVQSRYFSDVGFDEWLERLLAELVRGGALGRDGVNLYNI